MKIFLFLMLFSFSAQAAESGSSFWSWDSVRELLHFFVEEQPDNQIGIQNLTQNGVVVYPKLEQIYQKSWNSWHSSLLSASDYPITSAILAQAASANEFNSSSQGSKYRAPYGLYCVENNFEKCIDLGYTQSSCPGQSIACPYDPTLLSCPSWACDELGLFTTKPDDMECELVQLQSGSCFKCQCGAGFVDYADCDSLIQTLSGTNSTDEESRALCIELGYTDSITDCADYLTCPANGNQVRCLDVIGCKETQCLASKEVPANADPVLENKECKCGGSKEVITGWTCKTGYKKEGNSCVAEICKVGEFAGPAIPSGLTGAAKLKAEEEAAAYHVEDCYSGLNTAPGWTKVATELKEGGTQCYKCVCNLPSNCVYDATSAQEYGKLEDMCCDSTHYVNCIRDCPTDKQLPDIGAIADKSWCDACGERTEYISGWHCEDGYILSKSQNSCDARPCPSENNGEYFSTLYENVSDCEKLIQEGTGWQYIAEPEGAKSGTGYCHLCKCPYSVNDPVYRYSVTDTSNSADSKFSDLACNGKYKVCQNLKEDDPAYFKPGKVPSHAKMLELKICGETYYRFERCEDDSYTYIEEEKACLPRDCTGYNIEGECPTWGECDKCFTGGTIRYKLKSCRNDTNVRYKPNKEGTACCSETCDVNDSSYFVGTVCPDGKTLIGSTYNGCGEACIKCI